MTQNETNPSSRLLSIDACRGIAAVGVMLYHVFEAGVFKGEYSGFQFIALLPVSFGFAGVYLFFVVSGFCIHLRWVKSQLNKSKDEPLEFVSFWKRRIRRLYPAYLAAIVLYLGLMWWQGNLVFSYFLLWDITAHVLMIHNFDPSTVYSISSVFWTLAIEEQLYLAYFALIWLRNKYGWTKTLIICTLTRVFWFALAFALHRMFSIQILVTESSFANWCIWALGAIAVEAYFGLIKLPRWCYSPTLMVVTLVTACVLYYFQTAVKIHPILMNLIWLIGNPMWGFSFFLFINVFVSYEKREKSVWIHRIIYACASLGIVSYSLYLTHDFVIALMPKINWILTSVVAIAFAWVFYRLFEKRFMNAPVAR